MVDTIDFHLIIYIERIGQGFRNIREHFIHLLPSFKPFLLRISHTIRIIQILTCSKTEQMVVSLSCFLILKVTVVGTDQFNAIFLGKFYEHLIGTLLQVVGLTIGKDTWIIRHFVALQFQIVIITEKMMIPFTSLACTFDITIQNLLRNLASNTSRTDNQILMIFLQIGTIRTWAHIISVHP